MHELRILQGLENAPKFAPKLRLDLNYAHESISDNKNLSDYFMNEIPNGLPINLSLFGKLENNDSKFFDFIKVLFLKNIFTLNISRLTLSNENWSVIYQAITSKSTIKYVDLT